MKIIAKTLVWIGLASVALSCGAVAPRETMPFKIAVYIPVGQVLRFKDAAFREKSWRQISSQLSVGKVYIESYRSGVAADDALLEETKTFFLSQGVQVAGAIAYSFSGDASGFDAAETAGQQFSSFCYTDQKQRDYARRIAETAARHFDEVILDDLFFNSTKRDSDIAAKGSQSWPAFRLKLMDEVARDLLSNPARAVNAKVKMIVKFPNWYEHFQANGYDLDEEPKIFDGIYTGTETRDPDIADQHLQQYQSYSIFRYLDNIAPGRNGGGWVDVYDTLYLDRYAEQLWDTIFAKAPEIMLFQYGDLLRPAQLGNRGPWKDLETTFKVSELDARYHSAGSDGPSTYAAAAGYALSKVSAVAGKLGKPMGIASYKPLQSVGEDFLQNFLGMIGVPLEMYPTFPDAAHTVLLTEQASMDPEIIAKIRAHLEQGGTVIITASLLRALKDRGIEEFTEARNTGNVLRIDKWPPVNEPDQVAPRQRPDLLLPEIDFATSDASAVVQAVAQGRGAPLMLENTYSKGTLYVLTIPENANDLYSFPQPVLAMMRRYLMADFPVQIDAPAKVSLFAYDNNTFVVESYLDQTAEVMISTASTRLRNLTTGKLLQQDQSPSMGRRSPSHRLRLKLAPHSFVAIGEE